MAKRWIVLLLAVAMALAVVPLAAAGNGGGGGKGKLKFELVGTVSAVSFDAATGLTVLTVNVKAGTKTVKKFRGQVLTLTVDPAARVRLVTDEGCVVATLDQLGPGMKVKVRGTIDRTNPEDPVFTAKWIKAKTMPTPEPSSAPLSPAP